MKDSLQCVTCGRILPRDRFSVSRRMPGGYDRKCRDCNRITHHNSLARVQGLAATLTLDEWLAKVASFQGLCAYCGSAPYSDLDHLVDIRFGGGTTAANCFPVCHPCNLRKQNIDARMGMMAAPEPFASKNGRPHPFLSCGEQLPMFLPALSAEALRELRRM